MTDAELTRECAARVMGWHEEPLPQMEDSLDGESVWMNADGEVRQFSTGSMRFNPLGCDTNACMVLDKMAADGALIYIEGVDGAWCVRVVPAHEHKDAGDHSVSADRKRAIVIAALKACGVDV